MVVRFFLAGVFSGAVFFCSLGCSDALVNQTASLGGGVAGERGTVRVLFINNTPHRAVLTYGSFDKTDQFSRPDFAQFGLEEFERNLDGDSESSLDPGEIESFITCGRDFAIGSAELLQRIDASGSSDTLIAEALVEGVEFFQISGEGETGDSSPVSAGVAPPLEVLLGAGFPCNSLLIFWLEFDQLGPDPFRIDYMFVPSESDR